MTNCKQESSLQWLSQQVQRMDIWAQFSSLTSPLSQVLCPSMLMEWPALLCLLTGLPWYYCPNQCPCFNMKKSTNKGLVAFTGSWQKQRNSLHKSRLQRCPVTCHVAPGPKPINVTFQCAVGTGGNVCKAVWKHLVPWYQRLWWCVEFLT